MGETYLRLRRPGRAQVAFCACRNLLEELVTTNSGNSAYIDGLAIALYKEGISAYSCGDLGAAVHALVGLIQNYSLVNGTYDSASEVVQQGTDAYRTLGRAQVVLRTCCLFRWQNHLLCWQIIKGNIAGAAEAFSNSLSIATRLRHKGIEGFSAVAFAELYRSCIQ